MSTGKDSRAGLGASRAQETLANPIPPRPGLSPLSQKCPWQPPAPLQPPHPTPPISEVTQTHTWVALRWLFIVSQDHTLQSARYQGTVWIFGSCQETQLRA